MKSVILLTGTCILVLFSVAASTATASRSTNVDRNEQFTPNMYLIGSLTDSYSSDAQSQSSDIWPVEKLRSIPGPWFLLLFICLAVICIGIAWLWANAGGGASNSLPEFTLLDPFATANLRGGWRAVVRTAVLSLWNKNLIKLKSEGQWSMHDDMEPETEGPHKSLMSPIEAEVLEFLETFRKPSELFKALRPQIERCLKTINEELEELNLIRTARHQARAWLATIVAALVILLVGGTKLYLGSLYKKPVGFLVLLLPGALVALFGIVKPWKRLTKLGYRYLEVLQEEFSWLQDVTKFERNPEGIDPAFCVAIFGAGALVGVPMYEAFNSIFQPTMGGWGSSFCLGGGGCGGGGCGGGCGGCGGG